ncbi:MAG: cupin domain-containing protein [Chloroflexi bacterium]|nr:cupin domain-containing protein [Chloroflexota bacterium]
MVEKTKTVAREPDSALGVFETHYKARRDFRERQNTGNLLVKSTDRDWEIARQGKVKHYLSPWVYQENALNDWAVFVQDVVERTGKHRHQGALAIFVIEGRGYTVVDGVRMDWEKGDLILLPVKPGGCEHQHFNLDPGKPCKWLAMYYKPMREQVATYTEQIELSPLYTGANK